MAAYTHYKDIRGGAVAEGVYQAFGFGSEKVEGGYLVEIRRRENALSVTVLGNQIFRELTASDDGKLAFREVFAFAGLQTTTTVYANGKVARTGHAYSLSQGVTGIARGIPTTDAEAGPVRDRVVRIAAAVIPLVIPVLGPNEPKGKPPVDLNKIIYG